MFDLKNIMNKVKLASQRNNVGPIGMELAIEKIHLVQLEKDSSGKIRYHAKKSLAYSCTREELLASPVKLKKLLQQAFKSESFSGRKVVTVMPANNVRIMSVTYQVNKGQKDEAALLKLMEHRIQGDLNDYVIDYLPVRVNNEGEDRLAVLAYAKRENIINYLESIRKAGLEVKAMEIGPSAIKRLIGTISKVEHSDNVLVINFGCTKSYMTLISGRRLLFDHEVEFGEQPLLTQLSSLLEVTLDAARELINRHGLALDNTVSLSTAETGIDIPKSINEILKPLFMKLADEINRALIYAASETRGEPVKHVYLLGSIARWKGADKMLNLLVNIPVSIPNPVMMFGSDDEIENEHVADNISEIAVATGLALHSVAGN